jgi:rSAM/selenodomain-associated transferase 2
MQQLSIIIPSRNEAADIGSLLSALQPLRDGGHEVIVVDGKSQDSTGAIAAPLVDRLLLVEPGRAQQMNAGADRATGDVLWFLHADSILPEGQADSLIADALAGNFPGWGRFDVALSGDHPLLRIVESMMNMRSRLTGIATGDQGIFVTRDLFEMTGGYPDQPLMEDIELSKRLRKVRPPVRIRQSLTTSSRRWEKQGIVRTILRMWLLRLAYFLGVPAEKLALHY